MKATLSNQIHLSELTDNEYFSIQQRLTFDNPKYLEAIQQGRSTYRLDRTLALFNTHADGLALPRGYGLDRLNLQPCDITDQRNTHPVQISSTIQPRSYQERCIKLAIHQGGGVIVAPTGSGKTTMAIELAARLGQRCLILVKSKDLATQWINAIKHFTGLEAGLIGGGKWTEGQQFTVGLVQTLVKHPDSLDYGLVIVDECHNIPALQAYAVINRQAAMYRYGLSATLQRRDNLEFMIHAALGEVVAEVEASEVIGAVLPVTVSTIHHDFIGNPESWNDFLNVLANDDERNRIIIAAAITSSKTRGTVVLTASVRHAETLVNKAQQYGVDALLLHGQLPKKVREAGMVEAPKRSLIIGTVSLLSEGIDWPHVGAIVFASPVSASVDRENPSATRLIQSIGRGRRPYPGRTRAHVFDVIDNHPLGKSAYRKREEIYRLQGFIVR